VFLYKKDEGGKVNKCSEKYEVISYQWKIDNTVRKTEMTVV